MKNLDVFVTGHPRSGTTLLSMLMTSPENSTWCMVEPTTGGMPLVNRQAIEFEVDVNCPLKEMPERLDSLDKWGIKEVTPNKRIGVVNTYNPKFTVTMHRDIRDCVVSLIEFSSKNYTVEKMCEFVNYTTTKFLEFIDIKETILVPYEDFVSDEKYRQELSDKIEWPLIGDQNKYLGGRRKNEARDGIYCRRSSADREKYSEYMDAVHETCKPYQDRFGYE